MGASGYVQVLLGVHFYRIFLLFHYLFRLIFAFSVCLCTAKKRLNLIFMPLNKFNKFLNFFSIIIILSYH